MTTRDFGMGFFGRKGFGCDEMKNFLDEWSKMSDDERVEFINKRREQQEEHHKMHGHHGHGHHKFSVEEMDKRCEEWMKKTPEEKEAFMTKRKEAFHNMASRMGGFFGHGGFHGHFSEEDKDERDFNNHS